MEEAIQNLSGPQFIGFVAVVGGLVALVLLAVVGIAVPLWTWARRVESTNQLKATLAAAGFTADEIARIAETPTPMSERSSTRSLSASR